MDGMRTYPGAYVKYLAVFHGARDFFECHEIMEEHWKTRRGTRHESCWLALIRIAVACYHARRGNWPGARKMMEKVIADMKPELLDELGLDGRRLAERMRETMRRWMSGGEGGAAYEDPDLPIADPALLAAAVQCCRQLGWEWGTRSEHVRPDVVHRHLTRDRTAVIRARSDALIRKREERKLRAQSSEGHGANTDGTGAGQVKPDVKN